MAKLIKIEGQEPLAVDIHLGLSAGRTENGDFVLEFIAGGGKYYRMVLSDSEQLDLISKLTSNLASKIQREPLGAAR